MEKAIKYDYIYNAVDELFKKSWAAEYSVYKRVLNIIANAPTTGVVEVHCKDCKHSFVLRESEIANEAPYKYYRQDCLMCGCEKLMGDIPNAVFSNGFCNYGERRLDNET